MAPLGPRAHRGDISGFPVPNIIAWRQAESPEVMCGHHTPMRESHSERQCAAISTVIRGTGSTLQFTVAQITDGGVREAGVTAGWSHAEPRCGSSLLIPDAATPKMGG